MWTLIAICDNKLYQDGREVKEIKLIGNIIDIEVKSPGVMWIKIKD